MDLIIQLDAEMMPWKSYSPGKTWRGKRVGYSPKEYRQWKERVGIQLRQRLLEHELALPVIPKYEVFFACVFLLRRAHYKRLEWHDKRPDLTNLIKSIEDVCTGCLWTDDRQVVATYAHKYIYPEHKILLAISQDTEPHVLMQQLLSLM